MLPICNNSGDRRGSKGPRGGGFHEGGESLAEAVRETTVGAMVVEEAMVEGPATEVAECTIFHTVTFHALVTEGLKDDQCEVCRDHLPNYIFECDGCLLQACKRCRWNRL